MISGKIQRSRLNSAALDCSFLSLRVALEPMHEAVDGGGMYVPGDDLVFLNVDGDDDSAVGVGVICELIAVLAASLSEVIREVIALRLLHPVILRHYPLKLIRNDDSPELLSASVDLPAEGVEEGLAPVERGEVKFRSGGEHRAQDYQQQYETTQAQDQNEGFFLGEP